MLELAVYNTPEGLFVKESGSTLSRSLGEGGISF